MLEQLDRDLWVISHPLSMPGGIQLGTRTTIVRRADGSLLIVSPGPLDSGTRDQVAKLGRVAGIVAPNNMHHLFVPDWAQAFPDAQLHSVAGVVAKQKALKFGVLAGCVPAGWENELDAIAVEGIPMLDELVFLHRPTRTLLLTDICFNLQRSDSFLTRVFMRINDAYGHFGPSRMLRFAIKDKTAMRRSLDRILEWDFERVIVTHGDVLETGGRQALRSAYQWL